MRRGAAALLLALAAPPLARAEGEAPPAGAPAEAPAAPAPCALRLRGAPAAVVLGRDARVSIVVEGAPGEPPAVTASAGGIAAVRPLGAGAWEAEWVAPGEAYPQVAIVSAVSAERCGWLAVPLSGVGVAVAHAAPGASIRVTIGDATFGPARTDRAGEARVPVVVPPGVTKALHGETELDLNVPAVRHVHLAVDRPAAPADREQVLTLRAFAVDAAGAPRARAPLELSVSEGRVEALAEVAPGAWAARWTLPPGPAGTARARASLSDEPGLEAAAVVARAAGPAARLEVEPSVRRIVAGTDERVSLRIRVTDAAGNRAATERPRVEASTGAVEAVEDADGGGYVATLRLPPRLDRRRADVTVSAGSLAAAASIDLAPAAPERLVVAGPDAPIVADGTAEALLKVEVLDAFGNAVADVVPTLAGSVRGAVGAEPDGDGGWTLRYRPGRVRTDGRQELVVRAGPLDAAAPLLVVAPPPVVVVAPKVGFALSSGGLRSPAVAAEGCWRTPWLDGRLGLALEVGTFELDRSEAVPVGASAVALRGESRYVPVLASAVWDGGAAGPGRWWAAAGIGAALVASTLTVDGAAFHDDGWAAAAHLTGGWGVAVAGGTAFAEARVAWCGDPALETLRGTLTAVVLSLGYRWVAY